MFLLSSENLSPDETDSGDVEIIRSTLVLRGEGLSGEQTSLSHSVPQAQTLWSLQSARFIPSLSTP